MHPRLIFLLCAIAALYSDVSAYREHEGKRVHWNKGRGYTPFRYATDNGIIIHNPTHLTVKDGICLSDTLSNFSLTFRAENMSCHPSGRAIYTDSAGKRRQRKNPEWSFWLADENSDTIFLTVSSEEIPDQISSAPAMCVKAHGNGEELSTPAILKEGVDCFSGVNIWNVRATSRQINIYAGNHGMRPVLSIPCDRIKMTGFGFAVSPAANIRITDISLTDETLQSLIPHPIWKDTDTLCRYLDASTDPVEGYWIVFDRNLEESLLVPGGDYRLAIVKDSGCYLILYLSGARTNSQSWQPGMIKGILTPDPFPATYSLIWNDAEGLPLTKDIKAQIVEESIIEIQFPYHSSSMRLRKL